MLSVFGTLVERRVRGGGAHVPMALTLVVRRVLFSTVSLLASIGPTVFKREGEAERLRANWQLSLDGPIPIFATRSLTLTLTTDRMSKIPPVK